MTLRVLTDRERQIAALAVSGHSDKAIASRLGICYTTVRTHIEHIFRKLGIDGRVKLAQMLPAMTGADASSVDHETDPPVPRNAAPRHSNHQSS